MGQGLGASADADQALVSDGAASVSTLTGFDPSRIDALACECERQTALHLNAAYDGLNESGVDFFAIDRAIATMDRAVRLREVLSIAIAMEARQGTDPEEGLDGAAATARAGGIAHD
jgi:hypothetical protein